MQSATTSLIPGVYPMLVKISPALGGANNLGVGTDSTGAQYVIKADPDGCVAEFVGASICKELGLPHCEPAVVTQPILGGGMRYLFGSKLEPHVLKFDMSLVFEWKTVVAELCNPELFSQALAVDLCVGNDDRHAANWIVRAKDPSANRPMHTLLAMDFNQAWPKFHPPHHPLRHLSANTWSIPRHWQAMGITFDRSLFLGTCAKIGGLDENWLGAVLGPLVNIWLTSTQKDLLCQWWQVNWQPQVIESIYALEPDGGWL